MSDIRRPKHTLTFTFPEGSATPIEGYQTLAGVSAISLICDADFDGDELTLKTSIPGDTGVSVTASTGRVDLDSTQAAGIFPMGDLIIETDNATAGAATIVVLCGC